jgi:hypothetical protein
MGRKDLSASFEARREERRAPQDDEETRPVDKSGVISV